MSLDSPSTTYTDPHASYLATACLEFLLIELVPMSYRIAADLSAREEEWMKGGAVGGGDTGSVTGKSGIGTGMGESVGDEEEAREAVFFRLERLGYRVGLGIVERFSRDKPRFNDTLDVIKFLCKDLWTLVFKKQIDNLKTNHRGIYVLTDNTFKPLTRMSFEKGQDNIARAQPFLYFPAGIIRGALASMGINATVQAETAALPGATFQIRTVGAKP
ncbi:BET3 family protein [Lepidopterella palustris CBS 459.81]|uniref:BET3 family protein n=1 Tax=Lepidopterella palustris CBS 459.81 TaxID=1314670 RepID=A0A8E2EKE4_9PEZI|nr:BET3 family protein [Lepidopterella palustris CBS 459.81]